MNLTAVLGWNLRRSVVSLAVCGLLTPIAFGQVQVTPLQTRAVVDSVHEAVVKLKTPEGDGSGSVISADGLILTNFHVIARRGGGHFDNVAVHVMSDRFGSAEHRYVASYIVGDEDLDLALLRITSDADGRAVAKAFPFLRVGDFQARGLRLDDQITAWGFPLIGGNTLSSYSGSVHGFWGEIDLDKFNEDWIHSESARTGLTPDQVTIRLMGEIPGGRSWIRTTAPFGAGISGGAALDCEGTLIAVPTMGLTVRSDAIRLLRPVSLVRRWLEEAGLQLVTSAPACADHAGPVGDRSDSAAFQPGEEAEIARRVLAGGIVELSAGTFHFDEGWALSDGLQLIGSGHDRTTVRFANPATPDRGAIEWSGVGTLSIRNVTVELSPTAGAASVLHASSGTVEVVGSLFQGGVSGATQSPAVPYDGGAGIHLTGNVVGSIADSYARRNQGNGIRIGGSANVLLDHNIVHDNGGAGIYLSESARGTYTNNTIENNGGSGLWAVGGADPGVRDNVISGNRGNGIVIAECAKGEYSSNDILRNAGTGVFVAGGTCAPEPTIVDNVILENRQHGIALVYQGVFAEVVGNEVGRNDNAGIFINLDARANVRENAVYENHADGIFVSSNDRGGSEISRNTVTGNGRNGINCGGNALNVVDGNTMRNNLGFGYAWWQAVGWSGDPETCYEANSTFSGNELGDKGEASN